MSERFYAAKPISDRRVTLEGPEAHHLTHVMRAKVGDQVTLFDGTGVEFDARVAEIKRSSVVLEVGDRNEVSRESATKMVLGVSLPKSDRQRWLVEKAVELGVAEVVPLITDRGVVQPGEGARKRLERTVIEASKQCCRNSLMRVADPVPITVFLATESPGAERWIAHPRGPVGERAVSGAFPRLAVGQDLRVAIGPEGGFTDQEISLAMKHQWRAVDLGPRVLRIETAALALAAIFLSGT